MAFFRMSFTILKSLFKKPATLMYPQVQRTYYKNTRGSIAIKIEACIFCGICSKKCPTLALIVKKDEKSWGIERIKCIACNYCVEVCPKKCLSMENQYSPCVTEDSIETFKLDQT